MANESQYYNPIIQAMAQTVQAQQNQQKLEQQQEAMKQQVAASKLSGQQAQQAHDLAERSQKYYEQHSDKLLDLKAAMDKANQQLINAQIGHTVHDIIMHGGTPSEVQSIAPGIGQFPTREDVGQFNTNQAGAVAGAQAGEAAKATAPVIEQQKENDFGRAQSMADLTHSQRMELSVQQGQNALEAARVHGQYMQSTANINGGYHMAAARLMYGAGANSEQVEKAKQLTDGLFNGNVDWSKLPIDEKRLVTNYTTGTGELSSLPTNTAAYSKKLETMGGLQSLVSTYRDLAQNYSVDSSGSTGKGNYNVSLGPFGTHGVVLPGSDLKSILENASASGGKLATFYDQQSRKSDAEILRQVSGWFDPSNTVAQNQQKIQANLGQLQDAVKSNFAGMKTDRINKILGDKGITDFGAFQPKVYQQHNVNPQTGQKLGTNDGVNWFDRDTGQPYKAPAGPPVQ